MIEVLKLGIRIFAYGIFHVFIIFLFMISATLDAEDFWFVFFMPIILIGLTVLFAWAFS